MFKQLAILGALVLLAGCGGGGSSGGSSSGGNPVNPTPPSTVINYTSVSVNAGPPELNTGPDAYTQDNVAYVSVTLCAPGSATNCQTIPYVEVDTGSVGLRIVASALNSSLLSALKAETSPAGNPVGECYQYVDGYVFGSVRAADFTIGGESVSSMPVNVIGDSGVFSTVPSSCSSGGGTNESTVQAFGANGIIGIGVTTTDCGVACETAGGESAAIYYDCPSSGCSSIIGRAANATAPFQQVPNPVAAMSSDNNGSIMVLPASPSGGEVSMSGTLYFGIGTQSNNGLGSSKIYTTTGSDSINGPGLFTMVLNNQSLDESYVDSGTSLYAFVDAAIAACTQSGLTGFYCPASPVTIDPTVQGLNGASSSVSITINNANTLLQNATYSVLPGLGVNPNVAFPSTAYPNSFALGLPFFYGRSVATAIEGRNAAGTMGPYFAF
jgi:hypothetical protein